MLAIPHGAIWLVSFVLVEAAIIDGWKLKVPNWLTFHLCVGGLAFWTWSGGSAGLLASVQGLLLGLGLLLPLYAIGGMGAGDVKLFGGVGAWVGPWVVIHAFAASAIVGGVIALLMIVWTGDYARHWATFQTIGHEIITIRDPAKLSQLAEVRKPSLMLLPYGIPLAVGSIGYFLWAGMLLSPR